MYNRHACATPILPAALTRARGIRRAPPRLCGVQGNHGVDGGLCERDTTCHVKKIRSSSGEEQLPIRNIAGAARDQIGPTLAFRSDVPAICRSWSSVERASLGKTKRAPTLFRYSSSPSFCRAARIRNRDCDSPCVIRLAASHPYLWRQCIRSKTNTKPIMKTTECRAKNSDPHISVRVICTEGRLQWDRSSSRTARTYLAICWLKLWPGGTGPPFGSSCISYFRGARAIRPLSNRGKY